MVDTKSDAGILSQGYAATTGTSDHPASSKDSLFDDFWKSYADSAVSQPYNGISQLVNAASSAITGKEFLPYAPKLAAARDTLSTAGKVAEFAGEFAGMATDFALLALALRGAVQPFVRQGATAESVSILGRTMRPSTLTTLEATVAGAAYQGILQPSQPGTNLFTQRMKGAAIGGATAGSLMWLGQAAMPAFSRAVFGESAGALPARAAVGGVDGATAGGEPIGVAYMDANRTINVRMRLESENTIGDVNLRYRPGHSQYKQVSQYLGKLRPDEGVQLTHWPFSAAGRS